MLRSRLMRSAFVRFGIAGRLGAAVLLWPCCVQASQPYAYVANFGSDTVSVIDTATNMVVTSVSVEEDPPPLFPVANNPASVAATPDGRRIYVTNWGTNTVVAIDTTTNRVASRLTLADILTPVGIAISPDGGRAYVAGFNSGNVGVIDLSEDKMIGSYAVAAGARNVAIAPDGAHVYVTNLRIDGRVSVIESATGTVAKTVTVGTVPDGIAISPTGQFAYVTNGYDDTVSMIDTGSFAVKKTIPVGPAPFDHIPSGITMVPGGNSALVANLNSDSVSVIDTGANNVVAEWPAGHVPQDVAVTPDGAFAYVTNRCGEGDDPPCYDAPGTVSVIDIAAGRSVATIPVGYWPWGVAIASAPAPSLPVDLSITAIKPVQVIEGAPLVQSKHTMTRVYLSASGLPEDTPLRVGVRLTNGAVQSVDQEVFLIPHLGGLLIVPLEKLASIRRYIASGDSRRLKTIRVSLGLDAANFTSLWQPQTSPIQLSAVIDPDNEVPEVSKTNNTRVETAEVRSPLDTSYRVLFQRLKPANVGFHTLSDEASFIKFAQDQWNQFVATYPIALTAETATPVFRTTIQSHRRVDPLVQLITQLLRELATAGDDGFDRIAYVLPEGVLSGDGLSTPLNSKVVLVDENAAAFTVAHEVGHTYGLEEEYPPTSVWEKALQSIGVRFCSIDSARFPMGLLAGQGWDVLGADALQPKISADPADPSSIDNFYSFMGPSGQNWAPALDAACNPYSDLLDAFLQPSTEDAHFQPSLRGASPDNESDTDVFFVRGEVTASSCTLDPAVQTTGRPSEPVIGSVELRILGAGGEPLSALPLGSIGDGVEIVPFAVSLPFAPYATAIVLYRDGVECARLHRSSTAPTASLTVTTTSPSELSIAWSADDADGDSLEISFSYSSDGRTWFPLVTNDGAPPNPVRVQTDDLPGGLAVVRAIVTDGFNTRVAYASPVDVQNKPPTIRILKPRNGDVLRMDQVTNLYALAVDLEGHLAAVTWADDAGKIFAEGAVSEGIPFRGTRSIVATALDDAGNASTDTVQVSIVEDCSGDCNEDGQVTIDEILAMVNIALGNAPLLGCEAADANHDGQVAVDETLPAVNNALSGCLRKPCVRKP